MSTENWPYPRWIAHRGAGKLAPENTLAAFRVGASHGYSMFECDVKLSRDDVPFLMHDVDLDRTTNGIGNGGSREWRVLSQLDAGSWHSRAYAGEPLPCLEAVARYCLHNSYFLNIEIKPTPGTANHTGEVVAQHAARLWKGATASPLLTSFDVQALAGAAAVQPQIPRGLLLDKLAAGWLESALQLGCVAIVCDHVLWDRSSVALATGAGFKCLCYTVNDDGAARRLIDLGVDGIITDRVDFFRPA